MTRTPCFGRFDREQEECAYCCVAVECYESLHKAKLPGTETLSAKPIRRRVPEMAVYR